jgi:hypothetical protein
MVVCAESLLRRAVVFFGFFLVLELGASAVDLTPRYIDTFIDGVASRRLYFADGEKKIGIRLNQETKVESGAGGAVFRFTKVPDATFLIKPSPMTPDQPFEGIALERYREAARRLLPPRAQNVKVLEEITDPLPINRWTGRRFVYACDTEDNTPLVLSVTFLNLNTEDQLLLVTMAGERNFPEAAERSFQIIRTWQELLPGDERPPKNN